MRKVEPGRVSQSSVNADDAKHGFLRDCFLRHYGIALCADPRTVQFLDFLDATPAYRHSAHYFRYLTTFLHLLPHLPPPGAVVVETGGSSPILDFLAAEYDCHTTTTDLRYEMDCDDRAADLVLSCEVLEHLKDKHEKEMDDVVLWRGTGTARYAREIARTLRRGGVLVLTTPNATSARVWENVVEGRPPMVFRPHVREYTAAEVTALFARLTVVDHCTLFNFFHLHDNGAAVLARLAAAGGDTAHRGDDHFFAFRKD
jgi:SAM-dependent methyltransferase